MVEIYYNSGRFQTILTYMIQEFETPFDFFAQLGSFYTANRYHLSNHSKEQYYEILCYFWQSTNRIFTETMKQLCIYDICLHEKPKKLPAFTDNAYQYEHRDWISTFYESQEHIETAGSDCINGDRILFVTVHDRCKIVFHKKILPM